MLPFDFIEQMRTVLGADFDAFMHALQQDRPTSVRLNNKLESSQLAPQLPIASPVPWCENGFYLRERPSFTLDPLLHAGCYYVQEASSMFLREVLEQYVDPESVILDMCAAPGGKSTIISEYIGDEGLLVSNEVVRQRVFILSENMQKWGKGNTVVTHNTAADIGERLPDLFDCIVVDAPCSGEGMFRKDDEAVQDWSLQAVNMCAERQRTILRDVWPSLRPGGILIYSTCTYNLDEDDHNALWAAENLGAEILPIDLEPEWGVISIKAGYHFFPHRLKGEGFYLCAMRKAGNMPPYRNMPVQMPLQKFKKTQRPVPANKETITLLRSWLQHPDRWEIRMQDRFADAYPKRYASLVQLLADKLTCILTGFGIGELRGRNFAPQHSLSMLQDLRKEAFHSVELSREMALAYLRTEALIIPDQPIGLLLLTYHGVPLGFCKNIGNHCNNLYPNEWRIRHL